jgi:hypothetical protein
LGLVARPSGFAAELHDSEAIATAHEGSGTMLDDNAVPPVEKAVDEVRQRIGETFTRETEEWFTTLLNTFAAELVRRVVPETEPCKSEVLERARAAGVDIDAVVAPTIW